MRIEGRNDSWVPGHNNVRNSLSLGITVNNDFNSICKTISPAHKGYPRQISDLRNRKNVVKRSWKASRVSQSILEHCQDNIASGHHTEIILSDWLMNNRPKKTKLPQFTGTGMPFF
jgi:hypothetical protein